MMEQVFGLWWTQFWQVTIVAIGVWVAVKCFAKNRPHLAHALWILVLLKCLTPPVFSSYASPFSWASAQSEVPVAVRTAIGSLESDRMETAAKPLPPRVFKFAPNNKDTIKRPTKNERLASTNPPNESTWNPEQSKTLGMLFWGVGALIGLAWTSIRLGIFLAGIQRSTCLDLPHVNEQVQRLAKRLGIRRHVRVKVLDSLVGPAVIGLFRPMILLPGSVVKSKTSAQLEPLLAHELIHIRRGDLWWAAIQTLAQSLFWFHPLVYYAVRMVTRESERSCDEETVASLNCEPAKYARGLLDILELKQQLRVAPALPGVRPIDITSARLERIMKLGHGSHKRTPWWTWAVVTLCGALILPGAALVFGQDGELLPPLPKADASHLLKADQDDIQYYVHGPEFKLSSEAKALKEARAAARKVDYRIDSIDVSAALDQIQRSWPNLNRDQARQKLIEWHYVAPEEGGKVTNGVSAQFTYSEGGIEHCVELGNTNPNYKIVGDCLLVLETDEKIESLRSQMKHHGTYGFEMISVEIKLIENARETLDEAGLGWVQPKEPNENLGVPTEFAVLSETLNKELLSQLKQASAKVVSSPRIMTLNGQEARAMVGCQRPFVKGQKPIGKDKDGHMVFSPIIEVIEEGLTVKLTPKVQADGKVDIRQTFISTYVTDVEEFTFEQEPENAVGIQLPIVALYEWTTNLNVSPGETVVIRSVNTPLSETKGGGDVAVFLNCHVMKASEVENRGPKTGNVNATPVVGAHQIALAPPRLPEGSHDNSLTPFEAKQVSYLAVDENGVLITRQAALEQWKKSWKQSGTASGVFRPRIDDSLQKEVDAELKARATKFGLTVERFTGLIQKHRGISQRKLRYMIAKELEYRKLNTLVPDVSIRSSDHGANKDDYEIVSGVNDFVLGLMTSIATKTEGDFTILTGENLEIVDSEGNVLLSGDELEIKTGENFVQFSARGKATGMPYGEPEVMMTAENIQLRFDQEEETFVLDGSARILFENNELQADRVTVSSEGGVQLQGAASARWQSEDGSEKTAKGQNLLWRDGKAKLLKQ